MRAIIGLAGLLLLFYGLAALVAGVTAGHGPARSQPSARRAGVYVAAGALLVAGALVAGLI